MSALDEKVRDFLLNCPDEVLERISFSMPWQITEPSTFDADGFNQPSGTGEMSLEREINSWSRQKLQAECWNKVHSNPQINTSIRGITGRIAGMGFETSSEIHEIQQVIEETEEDWRNRLYYFWPKYVGRTFIDAELFLCFTLHTDGFVEIDFIDPMSLDNGGDDNSGIIFHPTKTMMPLFYIITRDDPACGIVKEQIPSIFVAAYPNELIELAKQHPDFSLDDQRRCISAMGDFEQFKGYYRFVVAYDKSFITRRAISHLKTTILWCNHYENLKKYEIDHKKSAGAYLWTFSFDDKKAFRDWLLLSDEDRAKTGIMAKKVPGGSLVVPPGVKIEVKNPQLPNISNQDTDILQMMTSGLNEAADVTTGTASGTFASIKATRGPMSDRTSDEIAYFDRFLRFDFWRSIFFLRSSVTDFPKTFKVREAVGFKNKEPVMKEVEKRPEKLIDISYPVSETIDYEGRSKAFLGAKHGPINETLGVPNKDIAQRMGIGGYGRARLRKATEDELYPDLVYTLDAEGLQEKVEAEPGNKKTKMQTKTKNENDKNGNDKNENKK